MIRKLFRKKKEEINLDEHIVWGEHPHQPLKESGMQGLVKKAFQQAGITGKQASPHTLRHTFGRIWHDKGGDLSSCCDIMGHYSPEVTKQYVNMSKRELIGKYDQFNPLISIPDEGITHDDQRITHDDQHLTPLAKGITQC
jgi:site-specific recombinase XerD